MKDHPQQILTLSLQKNIIGKNLRIGFYMRLENIIKEKSKRWKKMALLTKISPVNRYGLVGI